MSEIEGAPLHNAKAAKRKLRGLLADVRQLRGIGIAPAGSGYCVKVNLSSNVDDLDLPHSIDGVPIIVATIGEIEAL